MDDTDDALDILDRLTDQLDEGRDRHRVRRAVEAIRDELRDLRVERDMLSDDLERMFGRVDSVEGLADLLGQCDDATRAAVAKRVDGLEPRASVWRRHGDQGEGE